MIDFSPASRLGGCRFPREIVACAVRIHLRFGLSLRDVEDLLTERGVTVSCETIRAWVARFAGQFAALIGRARPPSRPLNEVAIGIGGRTHRLRRAVDADGEALDTLM